MPDAIPIVLAFGVAVCAALFAKLPGREAALIALIAGWVVLPTCRYPESVFARPVGNGGTAHALAVPTDLLVDKATAIGLGCLAGAVVFAWPALREVRPTRADLPVVSWCLVPVASVVSNGLPIAGGMAQSRYLVLVWGVPYLMGRAYLAESEGLRRFGVGLVLAGVASAPPGLAEFFAGPFLYSWVFGPHPYQLEGAARWLGSRPLVFQEHGNQFGMFAASSAVSAVWLWRSGRLPVAGGVSAGASALGLVSLCFLYQSHTAMAVTVAAVSPVLLWGRSVPRFAAGLRIRPVPAAGLVVAAALVMAVIGWKASQDPASRSMIRGVFASAGKTSFTWRLARSEQFLPRVAERPVLGWGRADWSDRPDHRFLNPVNLGFWLLASGMYGVVGLGSWAALVLMPVGSALRRLPRRAWFSPAGSPVVLAAVLILMNAFDSLLNSTWIVPLTAAAGGLNSWALRKTPGGPVGQAGRSSSESHARTAPETR